MSMLGRTVGKEKCRWTRGRLMMVKLMDETIDYGQVIYTESLGVGRNGQSGVKYCIFDFELTGC